MFTDMTSNEPVKVSQFMTFTILLEKFGTQTCLWFDLGDNGSLLVFGNQSCPWQVNIDSINPNIVAEPNLKYTFKHPGTEKIVIHHLYPRVGSYMVRMHASNPVSTATHEAVVVVLSFVCKRPNVTMKGTDTLSQFLY